MPATDNLENTRDQGSSQSDRVAPYSQLTLVGVEIAPPQSQNEFERAQANSRSVLYEDSLTSAVSSGVRVDTTPIFADASGNHFILLPTENGAAALPYVVGSPCNLAGGETAKGGFCPLHQIEQQAVNSDISKKPELTDQIVGGMESYIQQFNSAQPNMLSSAVQSSANDILQGIAVKVLVGSLGDKSSGFGDIVDQVLQPGAIAGAVAGKLADLGTNLLFKDLWQVDDSSSLGEQLAHKYAQELMPLLQQELLAQIAGGASGMSLSSIATSLDAFFNGTVSTANVEMARVGDPDTNDGVVLKGCETVLVNGMPAARMGDDVNMASPGSDVGPLVTGNPTIFIGGQNVAGVGHVAVGASKGIVTQIKDGSPNVLIGPLGMPVISHSSGSQSGAGAGAGSTADTSQENQSEDGENEDSPASRENGGVSGDEAAEKESQSNTSGESKEGEDGIPAAKEPDRLRVGDAIDAAKDGVKEGAERAHKPIQDKAEAAKQEAEKHARDLDSQRVEARRAAAEAESRAKDISREALEKQKAAQTTSEYYDAKKTHMEAGQATTESDALRAKADQAGARAASASDAAKNLPSGSSVKSTAGALAKTAKFLGPVGDAFDVFQGCAAANKAFSHGDYRGVAAAIGGTIGNIAGGTVGAAVGASVGVLGGLTTGPGAIITGGVGAAAGSYAGSGYGEDKGKEIGGALYDVGRSVYDFFSYD